MIHLCFEFVHVDERVALCFDRILRDFTFGFSSWNIELVKEASFLPSVCVFHPRECHEPDLCNDSTVFLLADSSFRSALPSQELDFL